MVNHRWLAVLKEQFDFRIGSTFDPLVTADSSACLGICSVRRTRWTSWILVQVRRSF
ncbi:hypothetical protein AGABI2DRAFT_134571 [Agaricus bisporus var. bisporus H97]|uniref:hypothetical protein n=1 Tax=Agaricus bisporus var. bisporus (strain H97 / ATCC MYA-4626 / FGSC 10389) TaxID=936046 RepID=UPI00029F668B|nr:hypothetical protein AGABI2DRAFT_134571 [Agaricus bisporus var. bisporus H97]EKV48942.1 hypothetical protein AGABI2DRAFT_134571 [Agaricus bisporus var. bisporus H97]